MDLKGVDGEPPAKRVKLSPEVQKPIVEKTAAAPPPTKKAPVKKRLYLDGVSLKPDELYSLRFGDRPIDLSAQAWERVRASRGVVERKLASGEVCYGINTGFGNFATTVIAPDQLVALQENLIRSHASGVGARLSVERTRIMLALRINVLANGKSGISEETLRQVVAAFNASCLSAIPTKGTVGASGDLAPLSHLALGLLGEGEMWSPSTGWADAATVLAKNGLKPLQLKAKEGLALINGTQFITALGVEALMRAKRIAEQATIVAAVTLDVLHGSIKAFDRAIHNSRPHAGQIKVAHDMRTLLHDDSEKTSEIHQSHTTCNRVQDAYSLRCIPQIHGIAFDTLEFVERILSTEINSATDNPMIFAERDVVLSGGNFHGEYPAKALDYLAIGIHELANVSERRIERLLNTHLNGDLLPPFLVKEGGLNSGFMIAHCAAASLVSENKVLTHPASVDSISTSAAKEDHVSMGGFSARKALEVVEHVEQVLAIELLAACQGLEFHRPKRTTAPLERVYDVVRREVAPWAKDRVMNVDIDAVHRLLVNNEVYDAVADHLRKVRPFHA